MDPNECNLVHNITACEQVAVAAAKSDFAARSGIPEGQITVGSIEFRQWPDSCLGVEQPGVACIQIITPGFWILLDTGVVGAEYHTDLNGHAVLAVPGQ